MTCVVRLSNNCDRQFVTIVKQNLFLPLRANRNKHIINKQIKQIVYTCRCATALNIDAPCFKNESNDGKCNANGSLSPPSPPPRSSNEWPISFSSNSSSCCRAYARWRATRPLPISDSRNATEVRDFVTAGLIIIVVVVVVVVAFADVDDAPPFAERAFFDNAARRLCSFSSPIFSLSTFSYLTTMINSINKNKWDIKYYQEI